MIYFQHLLAINHVGSHLQCLYGLQSYVFKGNLGSSPKCGRPSSSWNDLISFLLIIPRWEKLWRNQTLSHQWRNQRILKRMANFSGRYCTWKSLILGFIFIHLACVCLFLAQDVPLSCMRPPPFRLSYESAISSQFFPPSSQFVFWYIMQSQKGERVNVKLHRCH